MKLHNVFYFIIASVLSVSSFLSCSLGSVTGPGYNNPFRNGNRILYDGYTYVNNIGGSERNININFTSIGSVGNILGESAYAIIDSTFNYNLTYGQGSLIRTDTLYFAYKYNGDIKFLSYGYYRVIPTWIDLFRFNEVNNEYIQNFDATLNGQRWKLKITSYITKDTIYTGFGRFPVYKLQQRLQYDYPFSTDITFLWFWNELYGMMIYDEQKSGLIFQVARSKNY